MAVLDIAEEAGIKLQDEMNSKYGKNRVKFYNCDVTNEPQLLEIFDKVAADEGRLDVVINNAAIMNDSYHLYKKEIEINVVSIAICLFPGVLIATKVREPCKYRDMLRLMS